MKRIHCEYCGSESLEEHGGVYVCAHCQARWEKHTIDETMEKLTELLDDAKQEALASARRNLYDAIHEKYLDNCKILACVQRVQELYPEDFYAKFYEIVSGENLRKINEYLGGIDVNKFGSYIDGVIEYMLRVMDRENIIAVGNLIERAYNDKPIEYSKIQTLFEKTVEKIDSDIYEVDVPRDVFVAYKSDDMPKVMELVEYLEENGVSCFVALRNLRHGKNAAGIYEEQLKKAMDSCSIVLLVSSHKSRTTGDARYKELPYVRTQDLKRGPVEYTSQNNYAGLPRKCKKPRVEYLIENYKGFASEKFVKEFFVGCTWRKTPEEVYNAIYEIQNEQITEEENEHDIRSTEIVDNVKCCLNCGEKNPLKAKRCMECGSTEFVETYEKFTEKLRKQLEEEGAAKLEAERRRLEAEYKKKLETERKEREQAAKRAEEFARQTHKAEEKRQDGIGLNDYEIKDGILVKYKGKGGDVIIPKSVVGIDQRAFEDCDRLTSITIPNSVTNIKNDAFAGCSGLESITVASSNPVYHSASNCLIETASKTLALGCKNSIIPADGSVTSIGTCAFAGCSSLTSIEIPNSVTNIGFSVFAGCSSLTSIEIPNSVTNIGFGVFAGCSSLTSIEIPNSVTNIGFGVFDGCSSLTSINIPNRVINIEPRTFFGCNSLTSIEIPSSVAEIGGQAFQDCSSLSHIIFNGTEEQWNSIKKGEGWNRGVNVNCKVYFNGKSEKKEAEIVELQKLEEEEKRRIEIDLNDFEIKNGILVKYKGKCGDVVIPKSVTSIEESAFDGWSSLTSIEIPNSVTSIGEYAFYDCSGLTSIKIPNSVTSIGGGAFDGCSSLTSIEISNNVISIGSDIFYGTAFYNDESNWKNGVLYIGKHLIAAKKSISGAYIIKLGTLTIASRAFYGCDGLTSIEIPNSVTSIGNSAFRNCSSLASIKIPDSVTSIGERAFCCCENLMSIEIPDNVTSIGECAFVGCSRLTSIELPSSVTRIEEYALHMCDNLKTIYCETTSKPQNWHNNWLGNCEAKVVWGYKGQ